MSEEQPPPPLRPRRKLDIERPIALGAVVQQGAVIVYGFVTLALIAIALYMALVEQREFTSPWVAAPVVGAVWFGLRLFMLMSSRK